jgi:CheY-like chemotaxis protein
VTQSAAKASAATAIAPSRGGETILLVEDEEAVRGIAKIALELQGYKVLTAANGNEALQRASVHAGAIDLLATDIVMPGMSGRLLAEAVRAIRPGIRVLFMSGYTDDAVLRQGTLDDRDAFLQKPFSPLGLARKVRAQLDRTISD